jgi:8-oxo-dGTP diphosphatase
MTIAVAVVVHDGCVLVGRRSHDAVDAPGKHEFPGGKVRPDETPEHAAARECLEESGIAVRIGSLLHRGSGRSAAGPLVILFFAAAAIDDRAEPLVPFAWTPVAELPGLDFPAANDSVLATLVHGGS